MNHRTHDHGTTGPHEEGHNHHGHHHEHLIEVIVDRKPKRVEAGEYIVAAFKTLVGVAADRELDILRDGVLTPLRNEQKITVHECEVFVSHVPCGGSS